MAPEAMFVDHLFLSSRTAYQASKERRPGRLHMPNDQITSKSKGE